MSVEITVKQYPPQVGMMSLVAFQIDEYPSYSGNYCSIFHGPYLCNMWAENLQEWARRNPGETIEVTTLTHNERSIGVVTDERLKDWCNRLCVTGMGWPSVAIIQKVSEMTGISVENEYCGCESDDGRPSIIQMFQFDTPGTEYRCRNCHRIWKD
jgi:hypothetical protein